MAIEIPLQNAEDAIRDTDQFLTYSGESGRVALETRDIGQLAAHLGLEPQDEGDVGIPQAFEASTPIFTGLTVAITADSTIIVETSNVAPALTREAKAEIDIATAGSFEIDYEAWTQLAAVNAQSLPPAGLDDTNSLVGTVGSISFRVGRATNVSGSTSVTDSYFCFGADSSGSYAITVNYIQLALETWADRNNPNSVIPFAKTQIPDPGTGSANDVVTVDNAGGFILAAQQAPQGTGGSDELETRPSLPNTSGFSVGDIINVNGDLYELVATSEDRNVYRGTVQGSYGGDSDYYGDDTFHWEVNPPYNIRANLPKVALGASPPSQIYITFDAGTGEHAAHDETSLSRGNTADDTVSTFRYVHTPGDPGLEWSTANVPFAVSFYSDATRNTPINYHSANRWERKDREDPNVNPIAFVHNTDRWPKDKLPTDVNYTGSARGVSPTVIDDTFPGFQLTTTSADRFSTQATFFSNPGVDLDTQPNGEFHCSLELTLAPVSDTNMGFTANDASHRVAELTNTQFASNVASLGTFSTTVQTVAAFESLGVEIFNVPVYSVSTLVGRYKVLLVKNASNEVGVYYFWDGSAGGTGATLTAELRIDFWPTDAVVLNNNSRGRLLATSSALSIAAGNRNSDIPGVTWTLASNSGLTTSDTTITIPQLPASNQLGYWFYTEVGGTEMAAAFLNFGGAAATRDLRLSGPPPSIYVSEDHNNIKLQYGGSGSFPANTIVKVYMAVN